MSKGRVFGWLVAVALLAGCGKKDRNTGGKGGFSATAKPGVQVATDLRQIGVAFQDYKSTFGQLPLAAPPTAPPGAGFNPQHVPWRIALLPYLGKDNLYKKIINDMQSRGRLESSYWLSPELLKLRPKLYAAGSDVPETHTRYRVFVGGGAAFEPNQPQRLPASFLDGTSYTILAVEAEEAVPWSSASGLPYDPRKPLPKLGDPSRDDFYALMADGSVRRIPKNTEEKLIRAMITRAGGENIPQLPGQ